MRQTIWLLALALIGSLSISGAAANGTTPETLLFTKSWSHTARLATFTLGASDPAATIECQLSRPSGQDAWGACPPVGSRTAQYGSLVDGLYVFRARARVGGEVDPTPVVVGFNINVDTVAPTTTLTPSTSTTSRDASFAFTANEPATFECRRLVSNQVVDDWGSCTSPVVLTGLADGTQAFQVRATDLAGEFEPIAQSHTWLLDATAPETQVHATRRGREISFGLTAPEGTFQCRLTGATQAHDWVACVSPRKYGNLIAGSYRFEARALDRHGNADATPAAHEWQVVAPQTVITSGPANGAWVLDDTVRFGYRGAEGTTSFRCTLDARARSCGASSVTLSGLGAGTHSFTVAAQVADWADGTPARRTFVVPRSAWTLKADRSWRRQSASGAFLGRRLVTNKRGATLSTTISGVRKIALVVSTAPRHGVVKVYVGKRLLRTIRLSSTRRTTTGVLPVATLSTPVSGKLRIVVASKGRPVQIEGLGLS